MKLILAKDKKIKKLYIQQATARRNAKSRSEKQYQVS